MKTVLVAFGTRPEAIKMAPVVHALRRSSRLAPFLCSTAQHRDLLDQALGFFGIRPDRDLNVMRPGQDLFDVTEACLHRMKAVLAEVRPSVVLVQGDTATAFVVALSAFYARIPVGHVEAGLRTWNRGAPFPEEGYRCLLSELADFNFAPTARAAQNLRRENIPESSILVTGNTGIDALVWAIQKVSGSSALSSLWRSRDMILVTAHRRESFGDPLRRIFSAVRGFALEHPSTQIVYPVHPNPNVQAPAHEILGGCPNVSLVAPVDYDQLVFLMKESRFILTDSGGIQEEAPTLGKPVLVLRESTERPEAVEAGCARLVGSDPGAIRSAMEELMDEGSPTYQRMAHAENPFGDGQASGRIVERLEACL